MTKWYRDTNDMLDELMALAAPYCGPKQERYYELIAAIREWGELGDKATRMEVDERLRMKFYACKRVWKIRAQLAPNDPSETWAEWFARMFGQSIEDFAAEAKAKDYRERVRCYEIARFGMSPLEPKREAA